MQALRPSYYCIVAPVVFQYWIAQLKENGIDPAPERGKRTTWSQFLKAHWNVLAAADFFTVEVVRLPYHSPNLNAYAERFVRSIKDECLNRMIFFGERSLRKATREYAAHYHRERNHQGIENRLIEASDQPGSTSSAIECAQRLGGMLRFYHRPAA